MNLGMNHKAARMICLAIGLFAAQVHSQKWICGIGFVHGDGSYDQPGTRGIQISFGPQNGGQRLSAIISFSYLHTLQLSQPDFSVFPTLEYAEVKRGIEEGEIIGDIYSLTAIEVSPIVILLRNTKNIDLLHVGAGFGIYYPTISLSWMPYTQFDIDEIHYYFEKLRKPQFGFNFSMEASIPISARSRISAGAKYINLKSDLSYILMANPTWRNERVTASRTANLSDLLLSTTYSFYF